MDQRNREIELSMYFVDQNAKAVRSLCDMRMKSCLLLLRNAGEM